MKRYLLSSITLLALYISSIYAQSFHYPVDVAYNAASGCCYVSNWANGAGNVVRVDVNGQIIDTLLSDLKYTGGLCLAGNVLYVLKNYGLYTSSTPGYLLGYNTETGTQVCFTMIVADGYLDLVAYDQHGMLYITDEENNRVYRYDISQGITDVFVQDEKDVFGVCYDSIHDRILFASADFYWSDIKSIPRTGGPVSTLFSRTGFIEGLVTDKVGNYYYTTWGDDYQWGNEPVFKNTGTFTYEFKISDGHNRPFGLCLVPGNKLFVCNWGSHSVQLIDLSPFSVIEGSWRPYQAIVTPNPCHEQGWLTLAGATHETVLLQLFDAGGQEVYTEYITVKSANYHHDLPVGRLAAGVYCLIISGERGSSSVKVVIE